MKLHSPSAIFFSFLLSVIFTLINALADDKNLSSFFIAMKKLMCVENIDAPGHNITGVYEKIHFSSSVKVEKKYFIPYS